MRKQQEMRKPSRGQKFKKKEIIKYNLQYISWGRYVVT